MKGEVTTREEIKREIKDTLFNDVLFDVDTSSLTSIRTGGKALCYFKADKIKDLIKIIDTCIKKQIKFIVVGDGTNILFNDGYNDIVIIKPGNDFDYLEFEDEDKIIAGSAYKLSKFVNNAADRGYDFSEFSGIPGTVGGGVMGNSGSKNAGICDFIESINYISNKNGNVIEETDVLKKGDFDYRYFYIPDLVVLTGVVLKTKISDKSNIFKKIKEKIKNKKSTQPVNTRSAGCFFKNPIHDSRATGELIEACGLKGFIYGGSRISGKHANYIENFDNATSKDIFVLSKIVKNMVMEKFGIKLEYEVRLVGF
ncbi:MAG TPA: UDP-N-acetylmuramate dehydrogenase [Candidatus Humimicrobiaceae bacterium]